MSCHLPNQKLFLPLFFIVLIISLGACNRTDLPPANIEGWAPIYAPTDSVKTIHALPPEPIVNGGKIYLKGNIFYQVENGKGIHVIDLSDREHPKKMGFIQIYGCQEISIQNQYLYTNNFNDLVIIDLTNPDNIKEVGRMNNSFHLFDAGKPPTPGYFECIDPAKGEVVGWKQTTLNNPRCRY